MAAAESIPHSSSVQGFEPDLPLPFAAEASQWLRKLNAVRTLLWHKENPSLAMATLNALKPEITRISKPVASAKKARIQSPEHSAMTGVARAYWELVGYTLWRQQQYRRAADAFLTGDNEFLCGFMHLLSGNVAKAMAVFTPLAVAQAEANDNSHHWCVVLMGLVTGQLQVLPSILQIRHHLERDVAHLALAGQHGLLNQLCQYAGILAQVNTETYKLIGRGMLHAGYPVQGIEWLLLAQQINAQDPELYFHLGQAYAQTQQWQQAERCLKQCLMMTDTYPPAATLLAKIEPQPGTGVAP